MVFRVGYVSVSALVTQFAAGRPAPPRSRVQLVVLLRQQVQHLPHRLHLLRGLGVEVRRPRQGRPPPPPENPGGPPVPSHPRKPKQLGGFFLHAVSSFPSAGGSVLLGRLSGWGGFGPSWLRQIVLATDHVWPPTPSVFGTGVCPNTAQAPGWCAHSFPPISRTISLSPTPYTTNGVSGIPVHPCQDP